MRIKTAELIGAALDWAVAKVIYMLHTDSNNTDWFDRSIPSYIVNGVELIDDLPDGSFAKWQLGGAYSTDWAQGGPIIDREKIRWNEHERDGIYAWIGGTHHDPLYTPMTDGLGSEMPYPTAFAWGESLLIAAMRCYVASALGEEIDIPEELI